MPQVFHPLPVYCHFLYSLIRSNNRVKRESARTFIGKFYINRSFLFFICKSSASENPDEKRIGKLGKQSVFQKSLLNLSVIKNTESLPIIVIINDIKLSRSGQPAVAVECHRKTTFRIRIIICDMFRRDFSLRKNAVPFLPAACLRKGPLLPLQPGKELTG